MANIFKSIKVNKPKTHKFNLTHESKMSLNVGTLCPILCQEIVPGDRWKISMEFLLRAMPLLAPLMQRVNIYHYWFFVPNRLIYDHWEDFITGGKNGDYTGLPPYINIDCVPPEVMEIFFRSGTLADYLGCPSFTRNGQGYFHTDEPENRISLLPFNAYTLIYNEYFRDQNLTSPVGDLDKFCKGGLHEIEAGQDNPLYIRQKCWEKDYFTSALPWSQRGPQATMPLTGVAPVAVRKDASNQPVLNATTHETVVSEGNISVGHQGQVITPSNTPSIISPSPYEVDLAKAKGNFTINDLRRATRLQRWLELNATGGSRYIEQILAHFGVKSSDARLQRPQYLGGGRAPILFDDVIQTSATGSGDTPLATMSGRGVGLNKSFCINRYFEEHGILLGLVSIVPKPTYQQGMPKMFQRTDKFDYFWPEFQRVGEQEIKKGEVVFDYGQFDADVNSRRNGATFGYAPRYSEYKYIPSSVHGQLRDSLSFWHSGRKFDSIPNLNNSFVEVSQHSMDRNFSVESDLAHQFVCQFYLSVVARRPMDKYGTPSL